MSKSSVALIVGCICISSAWGQHNMVNMNESGMFLMNLSSGTSMNPPGWPMPMLMKPVGSWNAMFMAQGFLNETQQSGPRGGDKFYSESWMMGGLEHRVGKHGALQTQLM